MHWHLTQRNLTGQHQGRALAAAHKHWVACAADVPTALLCLCAHVRLCRNTAVCAVVAFMARLCMLLQRA
jgi:hypothetical protein